MNKHRYSAEQIIEMAQAAGMPRAQMIQVVARTMVQSFPELCPEAYILVFTIDGREANDTSAEDDLVTMNTTGNMPKTLAIEALTQWLLRPENAELFKQVLNDHEPQLDLGGTGQPC